MNNKNKKIKIWLDTDIGNDIDDSAALAYLLMNPDCELLGISTVTGCPVERAKLTDVICKAANKQIPIFPGISEPLFTPQRQPHPHQAEYLPDWEHEKEFISNRAIEAMYEAICKNPGEVTLLGIGPLTNIALLLKVHPDSVPLLNNIVIMCGEFFGKSRYSRLENEWNSFCDPYAAAIVYGTEGLKICSVGLDVTSRVTMNSADVKKHYTSPILQTVYAFGDFENGKRSEITYHDPLAAVCIFKPEVMEYRTGKISVELRSDRTLGRTYFDETPDGLHEAAITVNAEVFYEEFFRVTN